MYMSSSTNLGYVILRDCFDVLFCYNALGEGSFSQTELASALILCAVNGKMIAHRARFVQETFTNLLLVSSPLDANSLLLLEVQAYATRLAIKSIGLPCFRLNEGSVNQVSGVSMLSRAYGERETDDSENLFQENISQVQLI